MTNYDSGDIVISEFPFTDKSESKIRPVLILSNSEYNESRSNIIAAQITSQYSSFEAFYLKNWIELGLHEPSEITYNINGAYKASQRESVYFL